MRDVKLAQKAWSQAATAQKMRRHGRVERTGAVPRGVGW